MKRLLLPMVLRHTVPFTMLLLAAPSLALAEEGTPNAPQSDLETDVGTPADVEPRRATSDAPAPAAASPKAKGTTAPTADARSMGEERTDANVSSEEDEGAAFHRIPDTTWRKPVEPRIPPTTSGFDASHVLFELRFGAYLPRVDDEFGGRATPYADYFGSSPKFYFGLEADWLPARLPYLGSLGLALGWANVKASAKAKTGSGTEAGSETTLAITPMYAAAVFRADGLLHHLHLPIVPYVKAGVGLGMWQASGPSGTSSSGGVTGEGSTLGLHLAVGGSIALNAFDRRTAMAMRAETGIQQAYLWGEWMLADLDGFGANDVMRVGASTGVGGLAVEY
jgi:hypothetical protein